MRLATAAEAPTLSAESVVEDEDEDEWDSEDGATDEAAVWAVDDEGGDAPRTSIESEDEVIPRSPKYYRQRLKIVGGRGWRPSYRDRFKPHIVNDGLKALREQRRQQLLGYEERQQELLSEEASSSEPAGGGARGDSRKDAEGNEEERTAIKRYGAIQKMLPEDRIRAAEEMTKEKNKNRPHPGGDRMLDGDCNEIPDYSPQAGDLSNREIFERMREIAKYEEWIWDEIHQRPLDLASVADRELYAKVSKEDAQLKVRERRLMAQKRHRISDSVGTGASAPNAYVEIRARPGPEVDGPKKEAANLVVSRALGISLETASRLIRLGSVWAYEPFWTKGWERIVRNGFVTPDQILRVFPNPERFKTCYMQDWRERVKKIDPDFVVVDKPPMLPCFAKLSNGRESLAQCMKEALHVRSWGGINNQIHDDFKPCHQIDDEATGLIVMARHDKSVEAFDGWLQEGKVNFEFVALCTGTPEKGFYRHFYEKKQRKGGMALPILYEEIPPSAIKARHDYKEWEFAEMEVVATAPLPGGCSAVRMRCHGTGWRERIRAQLAMMGCPVLNDQGAMKAGTRVPAEAAENAGLIPEGSSSGAGQLATTSSQVAKLPLAGAVDRETLEGPYGQKLELLPRAKEAASQGIPQTPQKKVPVALHLARVEFGGRVVTCAPPAYWPEGAAAAVAVKLTTKDIREQVLAFLITQGGYARFGKVGGRFGVKVEWLESQFPVHRASGVVFASEDAMAEWTSENRIESGGKAYGLGPHQRRKAHKDEMARVRDKYVAPGDMGWAPSPTFKQIKKNKVKPVHAS